MRALFCREPIIFNLMPTDVKARTLFDQDLS